jgi:arylsulfatase A-like enzyme
MVAALLSVGGQATGERRAPRQAELPPPNIIVVMSDDQTAASFQPTYMPRTFEHIVARGTLFQNYVISTPLCCPSRATFLTGQYGHNNGVLTNQPGYATFIEPQNVLPVWLRRAGYRTAFFGKFLHGYESRVADPAKPAPGWGHWVRLMIPNRYQNYDLSINGRRVHFGRARAAYLTTQLTERAEEYVETFAAARKPLFMMLSYLAPHSAKAPSSPCHRSAIPSSEDSDAFSTEPLPIPPSFNEGNVSDKPTFVQRLEPLDGTEVVRMEQTYQCRLAALQSMDRGVEEIYDALDRSGELGRTVFIYTGDNGYFQGEHRLRRGKGLPYEESIRQPLAISVPKRYLGGAAPLSTATGLAGSIDLAPTILELAGAQPCPINGACRVLDGRSLMPLISGAEPWPTDRGILVEYDSPTRGSGRRGEGGSCQFAGVRTTTELYVEHSRIFNPDLDQCVQTRQVEHYNLLDDPYQLDNLDSPIFPATAHQQALAARAASLLRCAGRAIDDIAGHPPCE